MRLYHFDPKACADLAHLPAVGIHPGMPFVLDEEGRPVLELNRWLRSLPTSGVPAPNSWSAYATDLLAWLRFLDQRSVGLVDGVATLRDTVAAYHADRRMGDLAHRLAPSSWNRAIAAISRFYDWAQAENLVDAGVCWPRRTTRRFSTIACATTLSTSISDSTILCVTTGHP